jgi:hypothetical protein
LAVGSTGNDVSIWIENLTLGAHLARKACYEDSGWTYDLAWQIDKLAVNHRPGIQPDLGTRNRWCDYLREEQRVVRRSTEEPGAERPIPDRREFGREGLLPGLDDAEDQTVVSLLGKEFAWPSERIGAMRERLLCLVCVRVAEGVIEARTSAEVTLVRLEWLLRPTLGR